MANNTRVERLNAQILKVLSEGLLKLNDPNLNSLITFTSAQTAPNCEFCKVFVSILEKDEQKREQVFSRLVKATGFLKKEIASKLKLRVVPQIKFVLDTGVDNTQRIEDILKTLNIPNED